MMWPIFWPDDTEFTNPANTRHPSEDLAAAASTSPTRSPPWSRPAGPRATRRATASRRRELFPDVLPYVVGTPASYSFAGFNGRTLADNAPEAMLSLVTGTAIPSGLTPSVAEHLREPTSPTSCRPRRATREVTSPKSRRRRTSPADVAGGRARRHRWLQAGPPSVGSPR